jgi:hypothetical protein
MNGNAAEDTKVKRLDPRPFARQPVGARPEKKSRWPGLDEEDSDPRNYKAASDAENSEVARLVVMMGKDGFKPGATAYYGFQYVHIDDFEFGFTDDGDHWFAFLFSGRHPRQLLVIGRNLDRICDLIALRRIAWIRQADRDFGPEDGVAQEVPIITRISVDDWPLETEEKAGDK